MPLKRKLVSIGNSKAVVIPHDYLEYYWKKGKIIKEVGLEINKKIIILPIFEDINQNKELLSEISNHLSKSNKLKESQRRDFL
jgi:antitoxin component of MazEF toxin-antitoxin module